MSLSHNTVNYLYKIEGETPFYYPTDGFNNNKGQDISIEADIYKMKFNDQGFRIGTDPLIEFKDEYLTMEINSLSNQKNVVDNSKLSENKRVNTSKNDQNNSIFTSSTDASNSGYGYNNNLSNEGLRINPFYPNVSETGVRNSNFDNSLLSGGAVDSNSDANLSYGFNQHFKGQNTMEFDESFFSNELKNNFNSGNQQFFFDSSFPSVDYSKPSQCLSYTNTKSDFKHNSTSINGAGNMNNNASYKIDENLPIRVIGPKIANQNSNYKNDSYDYEKNEESFGKRFEVNIGSNIFGIGNDNISTIGNVINGGMSKKGSEMLKNITNPQEFIQGKTFITQNANSYNQNNNAIHSSPINSSQPLLNIHFDTKLAKSISESQNPSGQIDIIKNMFSDTEYLGAVNTSEYPSLQKDLMPKSQFFNYNSNSNSENQLLDFQNNTADLSFTKSNEVPLLKSSLKSQSKRYYRSNDPDKNEYRFTQYNNNQCNTENKPTGQLIDDKYSLYKSSDSLDLANGYSRYDQEYIPNFSCFANSQFDYSPIFISSGSHGINVGSSNNGDLRPYKCNTCNQSFSRNHDLKRHIKIHTGVKPYKCKKCGKKFGRSDALKRHSLVKKCRMLDQNKTKDSTLKPDINNKYKHGKQVRDGVGYDKTSTDSGKNPRNSTSGIKNDYIKGSNNNLEKDRNSNINLSENVLSGNISDDLNMNIQCDLQSDALINTMNYHSREKVDTDSMMEIANSMGSSSSDSNQTISLKECDFDRSIELLDGNLHYNLQNSEEDMISPQSIQLLLSKIGENNYN
ncbi:Zinc finger and BTB domain-containing protein 7C [Smittium culicis]|uniref:Zinc finger and BTB domain-containing protein 7C n=1 Tax=Smittium culicis TaxID=133412 RepID=A0A1R1YGQ1_9FUNG